MKFDEKYVPLEYDWHLFSAVRSHQVYEYLLLLKRFVEFSKDMSEESMRMYLVRAEYRYFKWIFHQEVPFQRIQERPLGNELYILLCA